MANPVTSSPKGQGISQGADLKLRSSHAARQRHPRSNGVSPEISIVAPMHNEEGNAEPLYRALKEAMGNMGKPYEIIFVNDASSDKTIDILKKLRTSDPLFHYCDLTKNVGENWALLAGVSKARGNIVVTTDGDFQNDPAFIPDMVRKLDEGYRVVSGWRRRRVGGFFDRILPSVVANFLISKISGVAVHDCGCGMKAYRREVLEGKYVPPGGMNRFSPVIFGVKSNEFAEVEVVDRTRLYGSSHYGIKRIFVVLNDLVALPFILQGPKRMKSLVSAFMVFSLLLCVVFAALGCTGSVFWILASVGCSAVFMACVSVRWNLSRYTDAAASPRFTIKEFQ